MKIELGHLDIEMVHHDPIIFSVAGILSESECSHFKSLALSNMKRSTVSGFDKENKKRNLLDDRRTSSDSWIGHSEDDITLEVSNRLADLVQLPINQAESFQVIYYQHNQEYQAHHDTFDPSNKDYAYYLQNGGQRIITVLVYLNDVEEGGETNFPNINKSITPELGKVVVFHDCYKGTNKPHPDSFHGGLPVIKGEKWAFNLWFREQPVKK